jgi:ribosomal protein S18 acetylase RimI-like enzyme
MTIAIRPITLADADSFHAGLDAVARERKHLAFLEAPALSEVRSFVAGNIESGVPHVVALRETEVVGWCDIQPLGLPTRRHCGTLGMGVLAPFRGQRIGERLLRACLDLARQAGISRVELEVRADNAAACALYRRLGFADEGIRRHSLRVDGECLNTLAMALLLPP